MDVSFGIAGEDETFDTLEELHAHCWNKKTTLEKIRCHIRRRYYWWLRNPIRDARRSVKFAYQRVFRGWDDQSMWGLNTRLSKTLGEQLIEMSEIAHGCPPYYGSSSEAPGAPHFLPDVSDEVFERWKNDLRKHGEALLAYSREDGETLEEEVALYGPAQEAMHWVAENLGSLWD